MPKQKFKDTVTDWMEGTSLRHLRNIPRAPNLWWKLFWIGVFFATMAAFIWQTVVIVKIYLDFNKDTIIEFEDAYNTPFPAVTICNLNPMRKSVGNYIQDLKELMTVYRYLLSIAMTTNSSTTFNSKGEIVNSSSLLIANETKVEEDKSRRKKREIMEVAKLRYKRQASTITISVLTSSNAQVTEATCDYTTTTSSTSTTATSTTTLLTTPEPTTTTEEPSTSTSTEAPTTTLELTTTSTVAETTTVVTTASPTTTVEVTTTTVEPVTSTKAPTTTVLDSTSTLAPTTTVGIETTTTAKATTSTTPETTTERVTTTTQKLTTTEVPTTTVVASTAMEVTTTKLPTTTVLEDVTTTTVKASTTLIPETTKLPTTTVVDETSTPEISTTDMLVSTTNLETTIGQTTTTKMATTSVQSSTTPVGTTTTQLSSVGSTTTLATGTSTLGSSQAITGTTGGATTPLGTSTALSTAGSATTIVSSTSAITTLTSASSTLASGASASTGSLGSSAVSAITSTPVTTEKSLATSTAVNSAVTTPKPTTISHLTTNNEELTTKTGTTASGITSSDDGSSDDGNQETTSSLNDNMTTDINDGDNGSESDEPTTEGNSNDEGGSTTLSSGSGGNSGLTENGSDDDSTKSTTLSNGDGTTTNGDDSSGSGSTDDGSNGSGDDDGNGSGSGDGIDDGSGSGDDGNSGGSGDGDDGGSGDGDGEDNDKSTTMDLNFGKTTSDANGGSDGNGNNGKTTAFWDKFSTTKDPNGSGDNNGLSTLTPDGDDDSGITLSRAHLWTTPSSATNGSGGNGNGGGTGSTQNPGATTLNLASQSSTTKSELTALPTTLKNTGSTSKATTKDPIIFEGLTQKELDALITKFQLSTSASRIALESQTQDRMLSIVNENVNASYSLRDILISCAYNLVPCDYDNDFSKVTDPDFGNCYTFNYNAMKKIVRAGNQYGLRMIALSNVSEYLETSSKSGMRVVVHKQNFAPFPNTEGINAGVGTYVNINVQYNKITRLGKPYGDCTAENDTSNYIYDGLYTYEGCFRTCYQQQIINECNCADPRFPMPKNLNISWCAVANYTLFSCYESYLTTNGDFNNVSTCNCHTGCTEPGFTLEISAATWPANITNYTTPMCWGKFPGTNLSCYDAYSENAVFIDIGFNRMVNEKTYERPSISSMNLFHQISGAAALWTGVSMLIFAELLEVLWFGIFPPEKLPPKLENKSPPKSDDAFSPYDSNIAAEYAQNVPQPSGGPGLAGAGLIAGLPAASYIPKNFENHGISEAQQVEPKFCFD